MNAGRNHDDDVRMVLNDPTVRAEVAKDPLVQQRRRLYAESAAGILSDLAREGFTELQRVGDLERFADYRRAIPILIDWLRRTRYLMLSIDIVRVLSVPYARDDAFPVLVALIRDPPKLDDPLRPSESGSPRALFQDTVGIALSTFSQPSTANDLIAIAMDRSLETARSLIVRDLPKTRDERVAEVLLSLLDDSSVLPFVVEAIGKMKLTSAQDRIELLLGHPDNNVRNQAKRALRRIS